MKFPSWFWILITGTVTVFLVTVLGWGWLVSQSSVKLLTGGVNTFPQSVVFLPKQTPGMVSLLVNPEKLHGWREVTLPLTQRNRDRRAWQQWEQDLFHKIGFDYRRDIKPWLGEEITVAITSLDYDRRPQNGVQPGYLLAVATVNSSRSQACLQEFYRQQELNNVTLQQYKGVNIIAPQSGNKGIDFWSSAIAGNTVLFANHPQILQQAINQAQAVSLNLSQSEDYQAAINKLQPPHIAIAYLNVSAISAWLDKSTVPITPSNRQIFSGSLALKQSDLFAQTWLQVATLGESSSHQSFLNYPELQQIIDSLPFDTHNLAYIPLQTGKSLLEEQIPLYKVSKLALKSLFPYLKAIAIRNLGIEDRLQRTEILFELSQSP